MNYSTLKDLIDKKLSIRNIATELNTSPSNIRYWLKKHEFKTDPSPRKGVRSPSTDYENLTIHKCIKCNIDKPIGQFYMVDRKYSNKPCSYCRSCSREKLQNKQYNDYKRLAVEYKGSKCICCGYSKCLKALEFHHVDPRKKDFNISQSMSWRKYTSKSEEELKIELDKCVLVCSNCHREIHAGITII